MVRVLGVTLRNSEDFIEVIHSSKLLWGVGGRCDTNMRVLKRGGSNFFKKMTSDYLF